MQVEIAPGSRIKHNMSVPCMEWQAVHIRIYTPGRVLSLLLLILHLMIQKPWFQSKAQCVCYGVEMAVSKADEYAVQWTLKGLMK